MANMRSLAPFRDRGYLARPEFGLFGSLQREIDRMFDDFARSLPAVGQGNATLVPNIDISETDNEILITAEIPVSNKRMLRLQSRMMSTIRGEKKLETDKAKHSQSKVQVKAPRVKTRQTRATKRPIIPTPSPRTTM